MAQLSGKTAIVTGASSGVGRAAALLFAAEGANVMLAARREAELAALAGEIAEKGGKAAICAGDVAEESFADAMVETAERAFGGLDIAFNNAGTLGEMAPAMELSLEGWRRTLDVNLTGAFLGARRQMKALQARGGAILFTSSFVGHTVGFPGMAAYAAAKAGLIGLSQCLAAEGGRAGIRVNVLLSGGVDTPMGAVVANTPEALAHVENLHALGRIAQPEEIARTALYLCSDAASFVTGASLLADGGVSIYRG